MSKRISPKSPAVLRPDHPAWGLLDKLRKAFDIAHDQAEPTAQVRLGRRQFLGRALSFGGGLLLGPAALDLLTPKEALAALSGFGTSNYINLGSAVVSAPPLSLGCWFKTTPATTNAFAMAIGNTGGAVNRNAFQLWHDTSTGVKARTCSGSTTADATSSAVIPDGNFHHGLATFTSTASRTAYLDGANKGTNTTNLSATVNATRFGANISSGTPQAWDGTLADCCIWNTDLQDADAAQFTARYSGALVRPQNLVAYLPLARDLVDLRGNAFSITGSLSQADHPGIFLPN